MSGAEDAVADKLSDAEAGGAEAQHEPMREFEVDLWLTDLNTTEVGVYQNSRNRAKSRQFTADMDIRRDQGKGGQSRPAGLSFRAVGQEDRHG
jgi:hypothetical protein